MGNQDITPTALWSPRNVGLVYQNTGHGTQDRVPNLIPRTVYRLLYMGTRGPGLQMEARNTFPSLPMGKSELSAGVMCTSQCITITINNMTL